MTQKGAGSGAGGSDPTDTTNQAGTQHEALDATLAAIEAAAAATAERPREPSGQSAAPKPAEAAQAPAPGADDEVLWPWGFASTGDGVFHIQPAPAGSDKQPAATWLCGPIKVRGLARTEEGTGWSVIVGFRDLDNVEKIVTLARADLLGGDGAGVIKMLAAQGLEIAGRKAARDRLLEALGSVRVARRVTLRDRVGWALDGTFFALPEATIGAGTDVVIEHQARGANFAADGALHDWRNWIDAFVAPHNTLAFFAALALAGPFLEPLGAEGGGFHLVGPSSTGKTTALVVAASVWGGPSYAQSWRATSNALEGVAAAHNDALLALDEIGICDPRDVGTAAYVLSGGAGKQRMRSDGDLRPLRRWRIAVASTGEIGLADKIGEDGFARVMAGQEVRLVDIRIDPNRASGVFDGEGGPEHFGALARRIKIAASKSYGTAGPALVAQLVANRERLVAAARRIMTAFVAKHAPAGADGQVARCAARFALVAAAGEIATELEILPFEPGRVEDAAGLLFANWLAARGGSGSSEERAAVVRVRDFINLHGSARFGRLAGDVSWRMQMAAGWRDDAHFYFFDGAWREALAGLDPRFAATVLHRRGYLVRDGDHMKVKVAMPGSDKRQRLYKVSVSILEFEG